MMSAGRTLPPIDFTQAAQCLSVLNALNPTDVDDSLSTMSVVLDGMCARPPEPVEHLRVLEEIRSTLDFVMSQASQRYAARAMPLDSPENERFQNVVTGWALMAKSYAFIAQRSALDPDFNDKRALLAQRRMLYNARVMLEYHRVRRALPSGLWLQMHKLFIAAERAGYAEQRVSDALNDIWGAQSVSECYIAMLLVDTAMPCGRSLREQGWIRHWAQRFAPYCRLQAEHEPLQTKPGQFALASEADFGLRPMALMPPDLKLRGIDTRRLATHIQSLVAQLKKNVSPASLGLGEDCVQPACSRLLVALYRPWGYAVAGRKYPRKRANADVQLCVDLQAIAFFIDGREFMQPNDSRLTSYGRAQLMHTFRDRAPEDITLEYLQTRALQLGYVADETWQINDQSLTGYRLSRTRPGSRLEHRQLLGVRVDASTPLLLAEVIWLQYQNDNSLQAGISILPGPAKVLAVRLHPGDRSTRERYRIGFLIPGIPSMDTEASLIVPVGWFLSGRRIEVYADGHSWFAHMNKLLSRGANFDRVLFSREGDSANR